MLQYGRLEPPTMIAKTAPIPSGEVVRTKLQGWRLWAARLIWLVAICIALAVLIAGVQANLQVLARGYLGLTYARSANGEIVLHPFPDLPAAQAGVHTGDVLLALNGQPITSAVSETRIERMFNDPSFARITVQVRHADGTEERMVVARDTRGLDEAGIPVGLFALYNVTLDLLFVGSFTALALLIFWRRGDDWFALLMAATLVLFAVRITPELYNLVLLQPGWILPVNVLLAGSRALLILWLCLFPNGRFTPPLTRWLALAAAGYYVYGAIVYDPYARTYFSTPEFLIDGIFIALGVAAQFYRYHRGSTGRERLQTRWVLFGVAIAFCVYYFLDIFRGLSPTLNGLSADYYRFNVITQPILYLAMMMVPLTMTISILRHQLWQIDILLSRTLVYVPLTAILAGVLAAGSSVAQNLFLAITGEKSDLAAPIAALVVVALFEPLKSGLTGLVDRYFKEARDPAARLKPFQDAIQLRIFEIDAAHLARRALQEAVKAFDAESGQIDIRREGVPPLSFTVGESTGKLRVTAPITFAGKELGSLSLGGRKSNREYGPRDRDDLERFAGAVAQALAESVASSAH